MCPALRPPPADALPPHLATCAAPPVQEAAASAQATPQLNRRSLAIAESLPQSARERLTAPREASLRTQPSGGGDGAGEGREEDQEATARLSGASPHDSPRAGHTAVDGAVAARAMERLYAESSDRRQRQLQREQEREKREKSGCTFRPELATSQRSVQPASAAGAESSPNRVAARSKTWAEARERRLEAARAQARAQVEAAEAADTLRARPSLSARGQRAQPRYTQLTAAVRASLTTPEEVELGRRGSRSRSAGPTRPSAAAAGKGPAKSAAARAHEAFLVRQARARELHRERSTVPHKTGNGWTGRSTEPVGPSFLERARSHGRARPQAMKPGATRPAARQDPRHVSVDGFVVGDEPALHAASASAQSRDGPTLMERPPNLRQPRAPWAGSEQEGTRTLLASLPPETRAAVEEARRDALHDPPAGGAGAEGRGWGGAAGPAEEGGGAGVEEEEEEGAREEGEGPAAWSVPNSTPPPPPQQQPQPPVYDASRESVDYEDVAGSGEHWGIGGGAASHLLAMQEAARSLELAAEAEGHRGGDPQPAQRPRRAAPRRAPPSAPGKGSHDAVNAVMPEPQLKRSQQRSLEVRAQIRAGARACALTSKRSCVASPPPAQKYYQRMRKAKRGK